MEELTDIAADIREAREAVASAMEMIDTQERTIADLIEAKDHEISELREHSEATMSVLTEVLIATDAEIEALKAENEELRGGLRAAIGGYAWPAELLAKTPEAK